MEFQHGYDPNEGPFEDDVNFLDPVTEPRGRPWINSRFSRRQGYDNPVATLVRNRSNYGDRQVTRLLSKATRTINRLGSKTLTSAKRLLNWTGNRGPWPEGISLIPVVLEAQDWLHLRSYVENYLETPSARRHQQPHWHLSTVLNNFSRNIEVLVQARQIYEAYSPNVPREPESVNNPHLF